MTSLLWIGAVGGDLRAISETTTEAMRNANLIIVKPQHKGSTQMPDSSTESYGAVSGRARIASQTPSK